MKNIRPLHKPTFYEVLEQGQPIAHLSLVKATTPEDTGQSYAQKLLTERLQKKLVGGVQVRVPGHRTWTRYRAKVVVVLEKVEP